MRRAVSRQELAQLSQELFSVTWGLPFPVAGREPQPQPVLEPGKESQNVASHACPQKGPREITCLHAPPI